MPTPQLAAWFAAVHSGDAAGVRSFVQDGIDVDAICPHTGGTALQVAASYGHDVLVEDILEAGANDELVTEQQPRTPLEIAGHNGFTRCAWLLFKRRIRRGLPRAASQLSVRLSLGAALVIKSTEVIHAARNGDYKRVEAAVAENTAFANAIDKKTGETALSAALVSGQTSVYEMLVAHGAYAFGVCVQYSEVLASTEPQRPVVDSLVRFATKAWDHARLEDLLDRGANPYLRAIDDDCSALAWAAYHGRAEFVDILLKAGAELDVRQCMWIPLPKTISWTAWNLQARDEPVPTSWVLLAMACWSRHHALVTHLLATQDDLHDELRVQQHGPTVLSIAVHQKEEPIVLALLEHGVPAPSDYSSRGCCLC